MCRNTLEFEQIKHVHTSLRTQSYSLGPERRSVRGQKQKLHNSEHLNAATIADANVKKTFEEVMVLLTEADHTDTGTPERNVARQVHANFIYCYPTQ